jgi:hypothetical protein
VGFTFILVLCLAAVFCLAPLSVYFLWLAFVTRRDRPTVLAGQWDFVGLVAGLSGFVLFGGGLVLSLVQSNFRYWMRGNFESLRAAWGQEKVTWILFAVLYLLVVVGWIATTLAGRRRSLVVYNVDPSAFETVLAEVLEQMNRPVERRGNLWVAGEPILELDRFDGGRTVTLRWVSEDRLLFQETERLVREAVRNLPANENPASRWLMACSVGAGVSAALSFGLLTYALSLVR